MVEHTPNPSNSGRGERRNGNSRPAQAKFRRPYLKNNQTNKTKGWGMAKAVRALA
jgi:hypothetical protein